MKKISKYFLLGEEKFVKYTLGAFSKPNFDVSKMLKVIFIGEASVDEGGPHREFFQLSVREVLRMPSLFTGWPHNIIPQYKVEAVATLPLVNY